MFKRPTLRNSSVHVLLDHDLVVVNRPIFFVKKLDRFRPFSLRPESNQFRLFTLSLPFFSSSATTNKRRKKIQKKNDTHHQNEPPIRSHSKWPICPPRQPPRQLGAVSRIRKRRATSCPAFVVSGFFSLANAPSADHSPSPAPPIRNTRPL